jgi:hypothetical protein
MEACDLFVGSTQLLCEHATAVTGLPSERFPNGVGLLLGQISDRELRRPRSPGPLRMGYLSGTITHDRDWAEVEPAVLEVMARHPEVELWLGGHLNPSPALAVVQDRVRRLPLLDWRELPGVLRDLDVNLAPLEPGNRFNEAKSAIKWLEAALTATPTVASSTEPFREAIDDGVNGLLATGHDAWVAALELLVSDGSERARLGRRARRDALLRWSPHLQADRYLAVLEAARRRVAEQGHHRSTSAFVSVANDEPPMPTPLQPYELVAKDSPEVPAVAVGARGRVVQALRARVDTWRRVSAEEGLQAAVSGTVRSLSRDSRRAAAAVRARLRS